MSRLELAAWRREVAALYAAVRAADPRDGWDLWRRERERLFLHHPQSPLPADARDAAHAPAYFDYDARWRHVVRLEDVAGERITLPDSVDSHVVAERCGLVRIEGLPPLSVFWLLDYAGGLFLSFRDAGTETYGGGRYVLDTAKGADLGGEGSALVVDFNFAYQPSCSYDPRWSCPLPPRENWLSVPVHAGERVREAR